jgi:glycogen debranching enzyme
MPVEITVGPPQLVINQGDTILVTDNDGQIPWPSDKGLYFLDTRLISSWNIFANGAPFELLNSGAITHYAARVYLTNPVIETEQGDIPEHTLSLVLSRSLDGGVHEDIDIANQGMKAIRFNLEIAARSDFADIFEVKSKHIIRRGRITTEWSADTAQLRTTYRNKDFGREVNIRITNNDAQAVYANGRLSFEIDLAPGASWHSCTLYELGDGTVRFEAPKECIEHCGQSPVGMKAADWKRRVLKIRTPNEEFYRLFDQAVDDMAALRLPFEGTDHLQFVPVAGVPWFVALFGRDSLIVSLQNALVYPGFARGALQILGSLQAKERDDYRDAEPGKIMHELRRGELAHFKLIPHTPYYGTADATILYPIVLHSVWLSTGDASLIENHLTTAENCLEWIDKCGDRDGDGFQEYETRSPVGYENQGWKDSGDAVVNADGSKVKGPKALCELQGYVYDAWLRMAEIYDFLGKADKANALRSKANLLFHKFNDVFWDEETGFYAYTLDGDKRQVMSVASNAGLCLWSGIVPPERAERVVRRLLAPDMCGGWGVRTLSADHPAYNPYSYQNGSVWPHDNGFIALGFRRYGFSAETARIAREVSGAGSYFSQHQMPELYSGIECTKTNFPLQYLGANVPQAWAAGSAFAFLQAILGLQPDAPRRKLYVDPALPDWLPDIEIMDMRVGEQTFDLRFWRERDKTHWEVLKGDPKAVIWRSFATTNRLMIKGEAQSFS